MSEKLLTVKDAVAYLNLPSENALHARLHRRRKSGWPITVYHLGKSLRFRQADLAALLTVERRRARG